MDLNERHSFNWIILTIGILAILANILLIWTARRLHQQALEIKCAMLLAVVDIAIAVLAISACILDNFPPNDEGNFLAFCTIKGPIDFLLKYSSLVLVALMAIKRFYKVKGIDIPLSIWIVIAFCSILFTILVIMAVVYNEFHTLSGNNCMPIAANSILSATVVFALGFFMLFSLFATLFAYLNIIVIVKQVQLRIGQPSKDRAVVCRVFSISLIYLLLIAPSSVFVMMEGSRSFARSDLINLSISLLTCLNAIANPCLVLFAHSIIFKQLKSSVYSAVLQRPPATSSDLPCNRSTDML
ncbi:hypothetical protein DSO57_1004857 [Entomophthora muscae]|uniref:Uncharacterized protein n=1 Tax=Entomophthora muscae TaxID=34485 RepID=A0ACC2RZ45_9FUNG|nr:hypothetical protein DSO57_1004857 [Entomophthora muscae]